MLNTLEYIGKHEIKRIELEIVLVGLKVPLNIIVLIFIQNNSKIFNQTDKISSQDTTFSPQVGLCLAQRWQLDKMFIPNQSLNKILLLLLD